MGRAFINYVGIYNCMGKLWCLRYFSLVSFGPAFLQAFFFKLELRNHNYGAATYVYCATIMHQNSNLYHIQRCH